MSQKKNKISNKSPKSPRVIDTKVNINIQNQYDSDSSSPKNNLLSILSKSSSNKIMSPTMNYASSAKMTSPDPSKVPHPNFGDVFDDGEIDENF